MSDKVSPRAYGSPALSKSNPAAGLPPCLAAIGGWADADWFSLAILSDPEVVAFELPKLAGLRQQRFEVVDRTARPARSGKVKPPPPPEPQPQPKRLAGKLAQLLDLYGATRAVASCRSRLLFESAPVLFFAELPAARLKQRSANKLRRELVSLDLRACVLQADGAAATLMMWVSSEQAITGFIDAAMPEQPLPAFDGALKPSARPADAADKDSRDLLRQIATLQSQVDALRRAQSAKGAMEQLGLTDARLKSMLKLLHPDKHANSQAATEAAQWLNAMRELLKGSGSA